MRRVLPSVKMIGRFFSRLVVLPWRAGISSLIFLSRFVDWFLKGLILEQIVWRWWLGYGERPFRVLSVVALILVLTWLLYWQVGTFVLDSPEGIPRTGHATWEDALYYSLVSFSALGYGNWAPQPTGWAQWVGAVQPFFGIISAVALSINLTQRISR